MARGVRSGAGVRGEGIGTDLRLTLHAHSVTRDGRPSDVRRQRRPRRQWRCLIWSKAASASAREVFRSTTGAG
jgi:hypothetical protein